MTEEAITDRIEAEPEEPPVEPERAVSPPKRRTFPVGAVLGLIAILAILVFGVWWLFVRDTKTPPPVLELVADRPESGAVVATPWTNPSDIVVQDQTVYVLDTGNNRILVMNPDATVDAILCETGDCAFLLNAPIAMDLHENRLFVANTGRGQIDVIDLAGAVEQSYPLPEGPGGAAPLPNGIIVADDGTIFVSDAAAGRVARLGPDGVFDRYVGAEEIGDIVFDQPAGLALDGEGNLYVAETNQGRIQKVSPLGRPLAQFWMFPGSPNASRPTDVAVTDEGIVLMTDIRRSIVHVFSESARYLGIIGLLDATRIDSPGTLIEPRGLAFSDDRLYVIDWRRGFEVFSIHPDWFESLETD